MSTPSARRVKAFPKTVDEWLKANDATLARMKAEKPDDYARLRDQAIATRKRRGQGNGHQWTNDTGRDIGTVLS